MMMMEQRDSVHVGNLGPIPLFLHWTFLIFLYLMISRYGGLQHPELALVALTVTLMGIILHELGHGLTAKALGAMGITITLGAFGGLCKSTRDSLPRRELLIVAAGPAVSFALAGIGWAGYEFLVQNHPDMLWKQPFVHRNIYDMSLLGMFTFLTMQINLILGIFNCLPIFPLDGGQLVYNAMLVCTRKHALVRGVCLTLAFVGAAAVLAWEMNQIHEFPVYLAVMFCFLLYNAYIYLR